MRPPEHEGLGGRVISEEPVIRCTAMTQAGTQCTRDAPFHDYENPDGEQHYCKQHATEYLWWYADEPQEPPEWATI